MIYLCGLSDGFVGLHGVCDGHVALLHLHLFIQRVAGVSEGRGGLRLGHDGGLRAAQIQTAAYANFTPYVVAGVLFVLLTIPLTRFTDALARRGGWLGSQSGLAGAGAMR